VIVLDTSGLLAALDADQRHHERARQALAADPGPLLLSPFVLAELDYLLMERVGLGTERALLDEVARGAYDLVGLGAAEVAAATDVLAGHGQPRPGRADASVVVIAGAPGGKAFTLLPADQS
jgi:uncharacterized protein